MELLEKNYDKTLENYENMKILLKQTVLKPETDYSRAKKYFFFVNF